jgi:hypothetical protein
MSRVCICSSRTPMYFNEANDIVPLSSLFFSLPSCLPSSLPSCLPSVLLPLLVERPSIHTHAGARQHPILGTHPRGCGRLQIRRRCFCRVGRGHDGSNCIGTNASSFVFDCSFCFRFFQFSHFSKPLYLAMCVSDHNGEPKNQLFIRPYFVVKFLSSRVLMFHACARTLQHSRPR